jgi:acylphosphatase
LSRNNTKARGHVFISGTVQGVSFRLKTREKANELGIIGWVRNLTDGKVEAVFEGNNKTLDRMIDFCKKGPPRALVKNVEILWEPYTDRYKDFTIIY